jgi:hypothetical protein
MLTDEEVLGLIPRALSREVKLQFSVRVLRACALFLDCDKGVTKMLASLMRVAPFLPEETLFTSGDLQRELLLLDSGVVEVIEEDELHSDEEGHVDEGGEDATALNDNVTPTRNHPPTSKVGTATPKALFTSPAKSSRVQPANGSSPDGAAARKGQSTAPIAPVDSSASQKLSVPGTSLNDISFFFGLKATRTARARTV